MTRAFWNDVGWLAVILFAFAWVWGVRLALLAFLLIGLHEVMGWVC